MVILTMVLTILLIVAMYFLLRRKATRASPEPESWPIPSSLRECQIVVPEGYYFHPCHTWVVHEGEDNGRVGVDGFVANLFGQIDRIDVTGLNRWVRQGQRLMTVTGAGISIDLPSPVEGVVKALNPAVLNDPTLAITSSYRDGWIVTLKSPDIATDLKNLLQGTMVSVWMGNTFTRLKDMVSQLSPALAQDGGPPLSGVLARVSPELQSKLMREFFSESSPSGTKAT